MRAILIALALSMTVLAGCADDAPTPSDDEADKFDDFDTAVAKGKGLIRGIVVDATITPIEGVKVTLKGSETETASNEEGAFQFTDLDPGNYFLEFKKLGFESVQASATVKADVAAPDIIRVQLSEKASELPLAVTISKDGYIGCSAKIANFLFGNLCGTIGVDPDQNEPLTWGLSGEASAIQVETVWDNTQPAGDWMSTIYYMDEGEGGSGGRIGNVWGPSPIVCRVNATNVCDNGDGTGGGGDGLAVTGYTDQVSVVISAGCLNNCVIGAVGYGASIAQHYTQYGTVFMNIPDPDPEWTFLYDGDYPVSE